MSLISKMLTLIKNLADARSELDFNKRKKAYQNAQMTLWGTKWNNDPIPRI